MTTPLSKAVPGGRDQRRAFQRYAVCLTVLVQPEEGAGIRRRGMTTSIVTNVSLSGLVFVSRRPHPPGSVVEIQISLGAHLYAVRAVVKRSQILALPGRRAFQCAAQFARGEGAARFIPALAQYLYRRPVPPSYRER